jgi:hypothetical protein
MVYKIAKPCCQSLAATQGRFPLATMVYGHDARLKFNAGGFLGFRQDMEVTDGGTARA